MATQSTAPRQAGTETPAAASPAPLPTPDASASLSPEGPWLILLGETGLWAVNGDGSGLRNIVPSSEEYFDGLLSPSSTLPFEASPSGRWLAYSFRETGSADAEQSLYLLSFPGMILKKVTTLFSDTSKRQVRALPVPFIGSPVPTEEAEFAFEIQAQQIRGAVTLNHSLAWSSDGGRLAFSAALDGPSTDVYVLDVETSAVLRLTDGSKTQAVNLVWTPDNAYIVHTATGDLNAGRDGPEFLENELWAADPDGADTHRIAERLRGIVRWVGDEEFLGYESEPRGDYGYNALRYNLSFLNVRTAAEHILWQDPFIDAEVDPVGRSAIIAAMEPAVYMMKPPEYSPIRILDSTQELIKRIGLPIYWLEKTGTFAVFGGDRLVMISPSAEISETAVNPEWEPVDFYFDLVFSPSETEWALIPNQSEREGMWIYQAGSGWQPVTGEKVCRAVWRPDGEALFFYSDFIWSGNDIREGSLYMAEAPDFQPRLIRAGLSLDCTIEPQWLSG